MDSIDWKKLEEALKKPFADNVLQYRVGPTWSVNNGKMGIPLAYIDARDVENRLDEVFGIGAWSERYEAGHEKGAMKCALTIYGITKEGWGTGDDVKGAESDALKRAAVKWGIGRYLYDLEFEAVQLEQRGSEWVLPRDFVATKKGAKGRRAKSTQETPAAPPPANQVPALPQGVVGVLMTDRQRAKLDAELVRVFGDIQKEPGLTKARDFVILHTGKNYRGMLTKNEASHLISLLEKMPAIKAA